MTAEADPSHLPGENDEQARVRRAGERLGELWGNRFAQQWVAARAERTTRRDPTPLPVAVGPSNFERARVPWGLDLAASWGWRLLVIAAAVYLLARIVGFFAVITVPLAIALLISALASPAVRWLGRTGMPRGAATGIVVVTGLVLVGSLLTFVGRQVAGGYADLADSLVTGIGQVRDWLRTGPLGLSDSQLQTYFESAQRAITESGQRGSMVATVADFGLAVGHVLAGFFIVLFATFFFLADGERIWSWIVRIAPRAARERVDSSGRIAWVSLTQFVRATVMVALVDALGIMLVAAVLGVPFVVAIGVLVFLGAFVPMVGATIAGTVAVLVALVDQGPIVALLMLGGVILVQQIEGHILQPFLMGRFVSVHPLGVIVAIGCGVLVAGVAGALVAVPLVAAGNAVVVHLAGGPPPPVDEGPLADDDVVEDIEEGPDGEPGHTHEDPGGDDRG